MYITHKMKLEEMITRIHIAFGARENSHTKTIARFKYNMSIK
jgi:hypothetical protein